MVSGIIFDMDGTIWNTEKEVCLAWNKVLADAGHPKRVTGDELAGYMGLPMTAGYGRQGSLEWICPCGL